MVGYRPRIMPTLVFQLNVFQLDQVLQYLAVKFKFNSADPEKYPNLLWRESKLDIDQCEVYITAHKLGLCKVHQATS